MTLIEIAETISERGRMDREFHIKTLTTQELLQELETRFDICVFQGAKDDGGGSYRQLMSLKGNIYETSGLMVCNLIRTHMRTFHGAGGDERSLDDI